jgi:DNA-binding NarL/FixJ family response regulator
MKILIADDHWVVRECLKQVMKRVHARLEPYEASTFAEAREVLREHPDMDLMLADLMMPGFDEFEGLRRLRSEHPDVPVVVVSVHEDFDHLVRSVAQGVVGYIPKSATGPEIESALERVLAGDVSFPRRILERPPGSRGAPGRGAADDRGLDLLTNREREVLDLVGSGRSVQRIAADLGLSDHTVRVHLGNLMRKLGLKDRAAVIHYAVSLASELGRAHTAGAPAT